MPIIRLNIRVSPSHVINVPKRFRYESDCNKHSSTCDYKQKTPQLNQPKGSKHGKRKSETVMPSNSKKHRQSETVLPSNSKKHRKSAHILCRKCEYLLPDSHAHYIHRMKVHFQTGSGATLQRPPWRNTTPPFEGNELLQEVYDANRSLILSNHQEDRVQSIYNRPLSNEFTVEEMMEYTNNIYDMQQSALRLNLEFRLILMNTETGAYRYFVPYSNEALFDRPIYVSKRQDLHRLRLQRLNITDFILRQRPSTKWKPVLVTYVIFIVFHLNYPLGGVNIKLPDYVKSSKSIIALDRSREGKFYRDHLCAFRCLATHQGHQQHGLESHTKILFSKWGQYMLNKCPDTNIDSDPKIFKGVELSQLVYFEKCFQINVNVFRLQEDQSARLQITLSFQRHDALESV